MVIRRRSSRPTTAAVPRTISASAGEIAPKYARPASVSSIVRPRRARSFTST